MGVPQCVGILKTKSCEDKTENMWTTCWGIERLPLYLYVLLYC